MGTKFYNPAQATSPKQTPGFSDVIVETGGVYKFMGCSVLSMSTTLGFNGIPSSLSVTLVEDVENGDSFVQPTLPTIWGFSLPLGGIGQPIIYPNGISLHPDGFTPSNTPFYFTGLCTNWSEAVVDVAGRTISVQLVDPREILSGVQCLLNGFSLSQSIGTGARQYTGINNIMDIFGYWNGGMESGSNDYGMPWNNIKQAIEDLQVTVDGIQFEFLFTGNCFINTPDWYRIPDQVIDFLSLVNRICQDGGSDLVVLARKVSLSKCVVEIRGINRTNALPLTQGEVLGFIQSREEIVSNAKIGREYKNESTSSVIIGGFQNSNYTAFPSEYHPEMHIGMFNGKLVENYNLFPSDIKVRLFGGTQPMPVALDDGSQTQTINTTYNVNSGAIFPYWGTTADDAQYPMIEPFINLDHLVFDKNTELAAGLKARIPTCVLGVQNFNVRQVSHQDVFIEGDGNSDSRPFSYLINYFLNITVNIDGRVKGLPLNTEVLRAALVSEDCFWILYGIHYPDIVKYLGSPTININSITDFVQSTIASGGNPDLLNYDIESRLLINPTIQNFSGLISLDAHGQAPESDWAQTNSENKLQYILKTFRTIIYSQIKQYAIDNMGKRFIVCLPASNIMQRIWMNLPVPTKPLKPVIEYDIDNQGYWEEVPSELSDIVDPNAPVSVFTSSETDQIRRRFMIDDGRFIAMVGIDWKPTGNINFKSNGNNKAMFQDLTVSEFRPNRIASSNPQYVLVACNLSRLTRRPDLAIVELPSQITYDNNTNINLFSNIPLMDQVFTNGIEQPQIVILSSIVSLFWQIYLRNDVLRAEMIACAVRQGQNVNTYANTVFLTWAQKLTSLVSDSFKFQFNTEIVMDLKGVIIPLTSNWVSYGPWYATYDKTQGMVNVVVDPSLVPWNYDRPSIGQPWDQNLNIAGEERLERSISDLEYVDTASITCAGFPEFGPASEFGFNSNITSITTDFSLGGVKTTYGMSTYGAKPGTFRKEEYDDLTRGRFDPRAQLPQPLNNNIIYQLFAPTNRNMFD